MGTLPRITARWDSSIELTFPYDPDFIGALKTNIPGRARSYDPATKVWSVTAPWAAIATRLMVETFADVERVDDRQEPYRRPAPIRSTDEYFQRLHLLSSAPACVIEASYRALAKQHHPDRLPATERDRGNAAMAGINEAFEQLRDRGAA